MPLITLLNRVCFAVCLVSIVAGVVSALGLIWTDIDPEIWSKSLLTALVFFLAGGATISVNRALGRRLDP